MKKRSADRTSIAAACGPRSGPERLADDPPLGPLEAALNHPGLGISDRVELLLAYRNNQLGEASLFALDDMQRNDPSMPVWGGGEAAGMHLPLLTKLASDPGMQGIMGALSGRILATDPDRLDIAEIWGDAAALAADRAGADGPTADSQLDALQAMATLANHYKIETRDLPADLAASPPRGPVGPDPGRGRRDRGLEQPPQGRDVPRRHDAQRPQLPLLLPRLPRRRPGPRSRHEPRHGPGHERVHRRPVRAHGRRLQGGRGQRQPQGRAHQRRGAPPSGPRWCATPARPCRRGPPARRWRTPPSPTTTVPCPSAPARRSKAPPTPTRRRSSGRP